MSYIKTKPPIGEQPISGGDGKGLNSTLDYTPKIPPLSTTPKRRPPKPSTVKTSILFICCNGCATRAAADLREAGIKASLYRDHRHLLVYASEAIAIEQLEDHGFLRVKSQHSDERAAFILDKSGSHSGGRP